MVCWLRTLTLTRTLSQILFIKSSLDRVLLTPMLRHVTVTPVKGARSYFGARNAGSYVSISPKL